MVAIASVACPILSSFVSFFAVIVVSFVGHFYLSLSLSVSSQERLCVVVVVTFSLLCYLITRPALLWWPLVPTFAH